MKFGFGKNIDQKRERLVPALSFLLPVAVMLVLFIVKKIYPFGGRSFLSGDLYHQYMPFFSELLRKVRGGEGLDFSFHVGIGSNFLALFVYYLASPFHLLALLIREEHLIEVHRVSGGGEDGTLRSDLLSVFSEAF